MAKHHWCRCGHIDEIHEHYTVPGDTRCGEDDCDCTRYRRDRRTLVEVLLRRHPYRPAVIDMRSGRFHTYGIGISHDYGTVSYTTWIDGHPVIEQIFARDGTKLAEQRSDTVLLNCGQTPPWPAITPVPPSEADETTQAARERLLVDLSGGDELGRTTTWHA